MENIKNCPFCSKEGEIIKKTENFSDKIIYRVQCVNRHCLCSTGKWFKCTSSAIIKWNKRSK